MTLYDELVARGLIAQVTDEEEIKELIKEIGLANSKAKNLKKMAEVLVEKFNSVVPQTYEVYKKGIESDNPEVAANVLLSLINVTTYLLTQQLKRLEADFLKEGGLRERMTKARIEVRKKQK